MLASVAGAVGAARRTVDGMEHDTGCTAADVVAALRAGGHVMTSEYVAEHWHLFRALADLFNADLDGMRADGSDAG